MTFDLTRLTDLRTKILLARDTALAKAAQYVADHEKAPAGVQTRRAQNCEQYAATLQDAAEEITRLRGDPPRVPKKAGDTLPTTPEAEFVSLLFNRKLTTHWQADEVKKFKELRGQGAFTQENLALIKGYYEAERRKPDGYHRRDLKTFLNNFQGELDRATAFAAQKPVAGRVGAASGQPERWEEFLRTFDGGKYADQVKKGYRYVPEFIRGDYAAWIKTK